MGQRQPFVQVVGHVHGGEACLLQEGSQVFQQAHPGGHVQGLEGFVQEEDFGLQGQGPGQGHPLGLSSRQASRGLPGQVQDAQAFHPEAGAALAFLRNPRDTLSSTVPRRR